MVEREEEQFATEAVLKETEGFLRQAGYELQPPAYSGFVQPDFHAKRKEGDSSYEIIGLIKPGMDEIVDGLAKLLSMKAVLGDTVNYVLVLPPVSEYLMIEFSIEDKGRWFFSMRDHRLIIWLCNPSRHTTVCLMGSPRDGLLQHHFISTGPTNFESLINMKLIGQLMAEEE